MDLMLPRERKSIETKKKIVEAAGRLMKEYDFRYLTVKNVCEEAGVAYGSFYHHFGSKENVVYAYCKELLDGLMEANPYPDYIPEFNFVTRIIWKFLVYAKYCELMGKDIIGYLIQNCSDDLFFDTYFKPCVVDVIEKAFEEGLVNMGPHPERLPFISDDVLVVYKGVVMCWFNNLDVKTHRGRLMIGMEHVLFQMLSNFRSPLYLDKTGRGHIMITDKEDFDDLFVLTPELLEKA